MVSLSKYRGKVLLIVNTATQCGLTPQYKPLQELYDKYRDKGLVVLGFPCNQFKGQAPGTNKEIRQFCEANYGVTFPQFAKIDVNGKQAIPLYRYLKRQQPFFGYLMSDSTQRAEFERLPKDVPINVEYDIQWNFTKFIVDRNGKVVKRVEPKTRWGISKKRWPRSWQKNKGRWIIRGLRLVGLVGLVRLVRQVRQVRLV